MYKFHRFFLALIILTVPFSAFAQETENTEKQKRLLKLAEEILADAQNLQLPENRAVVYAQIGTQLWQTDKKRGEQLFQAAVGELINAQNQAANESDENYTRQNLLYGQSPRLNILNAIANRDAELALKLQLKSRPPLLAEMVAMYSAVKSKKKAVSNQHYAVQELNLESQLRIKAAEQNPERAIELFRESLKSGVSYNSINFLQNLYTKSPDAANKLLEEVFEKLLSMKLVENNNYGNNDFYTMLNFLTAFGNANAANADGLKISDGQLRNLADKISAYWMNLKNSSTFNSDAAKIIEKFFPNRAAQIDKKNSAQNNNNEEYNRYNELIQRNLTGEELLAQADKFSNYKSSIYTQAAQKLAQAGNLPQAENILNANFSDQEAKMYLSGVYQNLAQKEMSEGNFDAAENLINQIAQKQNRIPALTSLAQSIYNKNAEENKSQAAAVLDRADSLIENPPSTLSDISLKSYIASAYINIEPEKSFRIIELLIPLLNEYTRAQAVVSKFQNNGGTRNGEQLLESAQNNGFNLGYIFQQLQSKDFDRTMQMINSFEQFEMRIAYKLQMLSQIQDLPISGRGFIINRMTGKGVKFSIH